MPPIKNERDARAADPCRLVTTDLLPGLALRHPGTAGRTPEGERCEWRGERGAVLGLTLYTGGGGLETLARNSEPTTSRVRVAGYPALETFTGRGEFCQYDVGVAPGQVVMTSLDAPASESCSVLQVLIPQIVQNLPPATG